MNKNREQKKPGTHKNSSLSSGLYFHMVGLVKKKTGCPEAEEQTARGRENNDCHQRGNEE